MSARALMVLVLATLALPASAQLQQGATLFAQGRYDEAGKLLSPLKNEPAALEILGRIAIAQGDEERAVDLFEKAVALRPNVATYHYRLGQALGAKAMKASMFKKMSVAGQMKDELEKAVALDPNHLNARAGLIDFYAMAPAMMGGGEEKAMQQAAEVKKRDAYMGHRAYARIYSIQKKDDLTLKEWQEFIREQPKSPAAHSHYGLFLGTAGKKVKEGFDEIELAIKLDPAYMPAWYRLGNLAANSGTQLARGEEAMKKYLTYQPSETEPSLANAHHFLGMIYEKQGKLAEARRSYAEALRFVPGSKTFAESLKRVSAGK